MSSAAARGAEIAVVDSGSSGDLVDAAAAAAADDEVPDPDDHSIEAQREAAWRLSQRAIDHLRHPDVMHMINGLVDPTSASVGEFLQRAQRGRARPMLDP